MNNINKNINKIIDENNNINNNVYEIIINSLNKIFSSADKDIRKFIYKKSNIKTRNTKLSFTDAFIYSLEYCKHNKTKIDIVNEFNIQRNENSENGCYNVISRTAFYEKEIKIPSEYYLDVYHKILKIYNENFNKNLENKLIAVDGTYNNTNVYNIKGYLETSLNMGFFDIEGDIPIDLTFNGIRNKNNELNTLREYILENKDKFKNVILVLDRAYCSYEFLTFLNSHKIKYVIRFRNNCKKIPKGERVIKFINHTTETIPNDDIENKTINGKKFKSITLKTVNKYILVTNIKKNDFDDDKIKDFYNKRWNIEVFFKIIKSNFKLGDLRITSIIQSDKFYIIHNLKILIIMLLSKIIEKMHLINNNITLEGTIKKRNLKKKSIKKIQIPNECKIKKQKKNKKNIKKKTKKKIKNSNETINKEIKKIDIDITNNKKIIIENLLKNDIQYNSNNNERKCILKPSKTDIIKCVFSLIKNIVRCKVTTNIFKKTVDIYIKYHKIDKTINNKRVCHTPFKKWYIKGYTNKSDNVKIVNKILGINTEKINSNLTAELKKSFIVKINYI